MNTALHLLLFLAVGAVFPLLPLLIGRLLRPDRPTESKDAIYECGEETIGTSYIRFDLRFYVVALLFIIFDVEILFFFPWATVFGTGMRLSDPALSGDARAALSESLTAVDGAMLSPDAGFSLGVVALLDLLVFFGVLLVGYAYLWKMGDLDWVRSLGSERDDAPVINATPVDVAVPANVETPV